jgi:YVTN family beta-propeller protein
MRTQTLPCYLLLAVFAGSVVGAAEPPGKAAAATLVVAHKWDDSVGFYDAASGTLLQTISVGRKPHEMALSRDGKLAYATLYGIDLYTEEGEGGRSIAMIDLKQRAKLGEIDLGKYRRPHGIEVGHRSGLLYVTCDHPASLLVVDPARRAIEAAIELADPKSLSHMVAVDAEEKTAFVANSGAGTVSVIDLAAKQEIQRISIGGVPMGMAMTADGKTLFATNRIANGVAVIDTAERKVKRMIEISGQPVRAHLTPDGKWLLVTLIDSGELAVVDARELTLVRRLTIGQRVEGITVDAEGRYGYASAQADNKVVKFSLADWKPVLQIKTATRPDPLIVLAEDAGPQQAQWRSQIKSTLFIPDPLPPLEAAAHGQFEPEAGIVAQRVTYASQFGLRVPAILYLPKERKGKVPALIIVNGHGGDKYSWYAFYSGILYARAGAAVLTFDPIGEGERHRERKSGTRAHDQKLDPPEMAQRMSGSLITDVMQAVSYLQSRPEIDPGRDGLFTRLLSDRDRRRR